MIIDIIVILFVIAAVIKGYSRGLIIGIFSLIAIVIGLAAAIKLSVVVSERLKDAMHVVARWLPILAFILVFVAVVLLVRLGAKALDKTAEMVFLGWLNKLAGIVLYVVLYLLVLSVLLFYGEQSKLIDPATIASSKTYPYIQPWGPRVIDAIGKWIPVFKDMFRQLEDFFAGLSDKIKS